VKQKFLQTLQQVFTTPYIFRKFYALIPGAFKSLKKIISYFLLIALYSSQFHKNKKFSSNPIFTMVSQFLNINLIYTLNFR